MSIKASIEEHSFEEKKLDGRRRGLEKKEDKDSVGIVELVTDRQAQLCYLGIIGAS